MNPSTIPVTSTTLLETHSMLGTRLPQLLPVRKQLPRIFGPEKRKKKKALPTISPENARSSLPQSKSKLSASSLCPSTETPCVSDRGAGKTNAAWSRALNAPKKPSNIRCSTRVAPSRKKPIARLVNSRQSLDWYKNKNPHPPGR